MMNQQNPAYLTAAHLLKQTAGRSTQARTAVLAILLEATAALSHQEVEQLAQQQGLAVDRVTLYRVLDWLVEQQVAHKVMGADRTWRYNALADVNHPQHAHFHCQQCHQVFCLENLQPAVLLSLPTGYQLQHVEINLQGLCPACTATNWNNGWNKS
jgi:Fur family ferric uptake transcriptional regulator